MSDSPGAALHDLRERKPLIHNITNYVVMNETANATLALGALPVMAHAPEEVEELAAAAGALVLNIGTLSRPWIDAMLLAGKAANAAGVPVVLDPVGAGATTLRTETAKRILGEVDVAVLRGNAAEVAALAGLEAKISGVEAIGVGAGAATIARTAATTLGVVASVTGPVDHVSDGDERLPSRTAIRCSRRSRLRMHVDRAHRLLRRGARRGARRRGGVRARRDRSRGRGRSDRREGPGDVPRAALRRALRPDAGAARPARQHRARVRLHAIVEDAETARVAAAGGATVIQLRLKGVPTLDVVERGRPVLAACREAGVPLVVNDDVEAALALQADGVHLGRSDPGKERAAAAGLILGISASSLDEAIAGEEQGATYIGAGPVWASPTKPDAGAPIGIDGLAAICEAVTCRSSRSAGSTPRMRAPASMPGAQGVAVVRASRDARAVRAALDAARL